MNTRIKNGGEVTKKSLFASIFMVLPFVFVCFGLSPAVRAVVPAPDGGYPGFNTAEGTNALFSLTSGVGNNAIGFQALLHNTTGIHNTADGFVQERLKTNGVVSNTACKAEQGISPLSRVEARIAAVRGRDNRSHCGRKPKADEYEREDHKNRCKQTLFHNFTSIFYSCIHCRSRYGRRNGRHSGALVGFCCTTNAVMRAPSLEVERDLRFRQARRLRWLLG